ncbi:membrane phosphoprotein [Equine molluscum contagiosum-like virus]|nr:membrane phosphoprotein [Equine molluscum contagiosum-like virus]
MVDRNTHDVHATAQRRNPNQETLFTRGLRPLLRNTFLYHDYAYGWVPETALWSSRFAELDAADYYPISLGLLRKLEYLFSLYRGPRPEYLPKLNTEFLAAGSFAGSFNDFFKRFAVLPTREFISFLLLTSMPAYNLQVFFRDTPFDVRKHTLFSAFYTTRERHVELARYLRHGGDYKPLFGRLDETATFDGTPRTGLRAIQHPGALGRLPPSEYETLANLSALLYFTDYDPVLMFLAFYIPPFSVTTQITPAVEYLMARLQVRAEDVALV